MEQSKAFTDLRRIGLLGGTFDPIHIGHLAIAENVRAELNLEVMVFIPAGLPPHKLERMNTAAHHRLAMLKLAIASNPHFTYSRVELDRPGPSYLVDTLHILRQQWGQEVELYFLMGWDSLQELHRWYDPQGILAQLNSIVAVGRPGYTDKIEYNRELEARLPGITQRLTVVDTPRLEISSSDLRRRVAQGRPIKYLVPESVEQYIIEQQLYRNE